MTRPRIERVIHRMMSSSIFKYLEGDAHYAPSGLIASILQLGLVTIIFTKQKKKVEGVGEIRGMIQLQLC
jgi:hypothetical protein